MQKHSERHRRALAPRRPQRQRDRIVSHAVQIATVLGLLATVVFAFLSWRESRLAREDQAAYFLAEKAPQMELVEVHGALESVFATFKNVGDSIAMSVVASATTDHTIGRGFTSPQEKPDGSTRAPAITLHKGQSSSVPVNASSGVRAMIGKGFRELDRQAFKASSFIRLTLEYQDVRGNKYVHHYRLAVRSE